MSICIKLPVAGMAGVTEDGPEPIIDDYIEYEQSVLLEMTVKQLGCQLIRRLDLFFPKREGQVDARAYRQTVIDATKEFIVKLSELAPSLGDNVSEALDAYVVAST